MSDPENASATASSAPDESCSANATNYRGGGSLFSAHNVKADPTDPRRPLQQMTNRHDFKRMLMSGVDMEEAYPGARDVVAGLNPEYYSMQPGVSLMTSASQLTANLA